jgi:hypothetical protein
MAQQTHDLNPTPIVLAVLAGFFTLIILTSAAGKYLVTRTPSGAAPAPAAAPAAVPAPAAAPAPKPATP